jgi:DNA-binding transcriptional LysR family regulator
MELGDSDVLQLQTLRERRCELAVAMHITPQPDMDAEALFHEQPLVWVGPRSKWLGRRKIGLAELADEPWILTKFDVQRGAPFFEAFRAAGLSLPQARITSSSFASRNTLMATGQFLTLIPDSMLKTPMTTRQAVLFNGIDAYGNQGLRVTDGTAGGT